MNEFERQLRQWKNQFNRWREENQHKQEAAAKRPQIKMCPACGRFNEAAAAECDYCNAELNPKPQGDFRADGRPIKQLNPVMIVFGICALVYLMCAIVSSREMDGNILAALFNPTGNALFLMGAIHPATVLQAGQWWRVATYAFLHAGVFHLFMNFSALSSLGAMILANFGIRRFWLISLVTAVGGGLLGVLSSLIGLGGLAVGFSGTLFGYIGALYVFYRQRGQITTADHFKKYMIWGNVICIGLTFFNLLPIANEVHIGGMLTGMALVAGFSNPTVRRWGDKAEWVAIGLCVLLLAYGAIRIFSYIG